MHHENQGEAHSICIHCRKRFCFATTRQTYQSNKTKWSHFFLWMFHEKATCRHRVKVASLRGSSGDINWRSRSLLVHDPKHQQRQRVGYEELKAPSEWSTTPNIWHTAWNHAPKQLGPYKIALVNSNTQKSNYLNSLNWFNWMTSDNMMTSSNTLNGQMSDCNSIG